MATERQIAANRRNAGLSTGPKSDEGKARSRANATRHGMAGESAGVAEGQDSAAFRARREAWAAEFRPSGLAGGWALDRAVAASLRIERCERAVEGLVVSCAERARLAWSQDRDVEAAELAKRIAWAPELVARQLSGSYHGAGLLIETWERLEACLLAEDGEWTEGECSTALDLLGVAADLRRGPTPIDDPAGGDLRAFRLAIASREIAHLDDLRAGPLDALDNLAREQATDGDVALLGKEAKLLLRYERDAWRRYRESLKELQNPAPAANPIAPSRVVEAPRAAPSPSPRSAETPADEGDPYQALKARYAREYGPEFFSKDAMAAIIAGTDPMAGRAAPEPATERTQFAGGPASEASASR